MAPCPDVVAKPLRKSQAYLPEDVPCSHHTGALPFAARHAPQSSHGPSAPWPLLLRGLGSLTESNPFDHPPPALAFGAWFLASSSEHLLTTISTTRDLVSHTKPRIEPVLGRILRPRAASWPPLPTSNSRRNAWTAGPSWRGSLRTAAQPAASSQQPACQGAVLLPYPPPALLSQCLPETGNPSPGAVPAPPHWWSLRFRGGSRPPSCDMVRIY